MVFLGALSLGTYVEARMHYDNILWLEEDGTPP
jgi:hypothetical protein